MIPRIIHYCWFGRGQMPELALKCIESWHKYMPDYQYKLWNEDNFDINSIPYVKEAIVYGKDNVIVAEVYLDEEAPDAKERIDADIRI